MKFFVEYGSPEYYKDKKWTFGWGLMMALVAEIPSLILGAILLQCGASGLFAAGVAVALFIAICSVLSFLKGKEKT